MIRNNHFTWKNTFWGGFFYIPWHPPHLDSTCWNNPALWLADRNGGCGEMTVSMCEQGEDRKEGCGELTVTHTSKVKNKPLTLAIVCLLTWLMMISLFLQDNPPSKTIPESVSVVSIRHFFLFHIINNSYHCCTEEATTVLLFVSKNTSRGLRHK